MISAIFHGILVGLFLAIMVGPVFLALMSVTITQGKKKAYRFMIGNSLSDILFAILSYKGLMMRYHKHSESGFIIGVIGAILFLGYGVYLLRKKENNNDITIDTQKGSGKLSNILLLGRGFIMNGLNPSIGVFRVTVVGQFIHKSHNATQTNIRIFLISILTTFIVTDIIKINSAHWILKKLTIKNLDTVHNIAGVFLIIAGIILLLRVVL